MKNRKLNSHGNTLEVQMKRFCSDIMLQPRAVSSLYSFTLPLINTSVLPLESECPNVNQNKHKAHVIPGLHYININVFAIQKPPKCTYFAEILHGFKISLLFSITPPTHTHFFVFCFSRLSKGVSCRTNETGFPDCLGL